MKNVFTYNLSCDFIKEFSSFLHENYIKRGKDLNKLAVIFGGSRPRLFLQRELIKKIKKPFLPAKFFSMDEFVEFVLLKTGPYTKISDLDACFIIYRLSQEQAPDVLEGRDTFSKFMPWAREILAFIEQLDLESVKAKPLKDIQHHAAIGYDVPESINRLLSRIVTLREAFHGVLKDKRSYTRGFMYSLAAQQIEKEEFNDFEQFFFCNFFYLHKTEESLLKSLYDRKKATLFFQGDDRKWSVLAGVSKNFGFAIRPEAEKDSACELSIHTGFDLHSQVCHVREVLKTVNNPEDTVIVLPDPGSIIPLLSESAVYMGNFNISMGYPVARSSLYSLFESLFLAQETKNDEGYYAKDYLRLLSHPLVKNLSFSHDVGAMRILVHKIEEALVGVLDTPLGGSLFVKLEDICEEVAIYEAALEMARRVGIDIKAEDLKVALKSVHELLFTNWEGVNSIGEFSSHLKEFLDVLLEKSFLDKYPINLKVIEKMYCISEEFNRASFRDEIFARDDVFKVFKNRIEPEMVNFSGSPLSGLQILGLFETRSLNFKNVIILDANESVLPKLKIHEPLIPRDVSLSLGLNRLEKEEEIQRYQFMRLISCASRAHIFYQDNANKERSRFVEELIWEKQKAAANKDAIVAPEKPAEFREGSLAGFAFSRAGFTVKVAAKDIEIQKKPYAIEFLKKFRYSASSVNTYLHCPLRFYYQYVLGLYEKESLPDEPEAKEIGTFIHNFLESAFKKFVGRKPRIDAEFREYFRQLLKIKFDNEFKKKMKSDAFLVKEVLDLRLERFLDNEAEQDTARIECVERVYESSMNLCNMSFSFKAKIDRIDRLEDGSLLIIDYKTGSSDIMPASAERVRSAGFSRRAIKDSVKSFQLPIYYYLVRQQEEGAGINAALYNIRNLEKSYFFKDEDDCSSRQEAIGIFMKSLEFLFCEMLDPKISFKADQEDNRYCRNCPFFYLCR